MERRINSGHDTIIFNFFKKCPGRVVGRQSFSFFKFITIFFLNFKAFLKKTNNF